ncbi:uncharacterized protein [Diadema setosum]|uniref:uncharacterized protein n=1 Tax=Diadema setosum TaxID=31175 RepID=UPI003B3A4175
MATMASPGKADPGQDPVAKLAAFLHQNNSDIKILTGKSKLSLTTVYLAILNRCFATTNPSDSPTESCEGAQRYDAESVAYLRDILHRTVALKLLHETTTLQGAVDVSRFHALSVLEVKRVPIHLLVGLSSLRHQLKVLICSRCVHSLQMLLVGCGGDKAEEQDWPVLHTLNLSYNYIEALDESLRFLPALKALDLSHNNIRHTRDYLESIPEITQLNLSFNQLTRIPPMGDMVPNRLHTLILRGNNIESLSGIEYLKDLRTLDLAKNAIFDTSELFSLGYLHSLRNMYFHGNPFTFEGKWRVVVAGYLAPEAAQVRTFIDEFLLSKAELLVVPKKSLERPVCPEYISDNFCASYQSPERSYDNLEESLDVDQSEKKRKMRVKRSSLKVRNASISEQSDEHSSRGRSRTSSDSAAKSTAISKSTPGTDAKKEFEVMRKMHGKDWLLALQNPYEDVSKPVQPLVKDAKETDPTPGHASPDKQGDGGQGRNSKAIVKADVHVIPEAVESDSQGPVQETGTRVDADSKEGVAVATEDNAGELSADAQSSEQIDLLMRQDSELRVRIRDGDLNDVEHPGKTSNDEPDLCGPFLVRLVGTDPPVQLFVTVKPSVIEEKNIYGKVVQRLDTRSLKGMKMGLESKVDEASGASVELPVVNLSFDYINRDRRKREYIMDDLDGFQTLIQVLEPVLAQNEASRAKAELVFMECLKCHREFPKTQAKLRVEKKPRRSGNWQSEEESGSEFESVNEVATCPYCGSTLLVELDDPKRSEVNTPIGSVASIDLSSRPMAASSPWKSREKDALLVSPSNKPSLIQAFTDVFSLGSSEPAQSRAKSSKLLGNGASDAYQDSLMASENGIHHSKELAPSPVKDYASSPAKESSMTTSSSSSQLSGTSSDFRLPDPTIKMDHSLHTPVDELASYPPEKLKELLTTNTSGFKQRYSLCPTDAGSLSSREASGPPTPIHFVAASPFDSPAAVRRGDPRTLTPQKGSTPHSGDEVGELVYGNSKDQSKDRTPTAPSADEHAGNHQPNHTYSEDDIVVLDNSEAVSQHSMDFGNAYHLRGTQSERDAAPDAVSYGRLDSNESDIAVISEAEPQSSASAQTLPRNSSAGNLSLTSDNVFEGGHHGSWNQPGMGSPLIRRRQETSDNSKDFLAVYNSQSGSDTPNDINGRNHSDVTTPAEQPFPHSPNTASQLSASVTELSMLEMAEQDCCNVHHRLKLFLSMSVFGDDEELTCILRGNIWLINKKTNYDGLVVLSTENLYFLKIVREESETPSDWLAKRSQHPVKDLARIHLGLGSQSLQFEFSSEGALYTIVTGHKKRTRQFTNTAANTLSAGTWRKKFKGIVWENPQTLLNLTSEVFVPQATGDTSYEVDPQISVYIIAQLKIASTSKQGTSVKVKEVGVLVTATDVYLMEENHCYPMTLKNKKGVKGQQFTPCGHRKICDISGLELYEDSTTDVTISFFSEDTGEESQWDVCTFSPESLDQLLAVIKEPWKEMFGVDIQETVHPSLLVQEMA